MNGRLDEPELALPLTGTCLSPAGEMDMMKPNGRTLEPC